MAEDEDKKLREIIREFGTDFDSTLAEALANKEQLVMLDVIDGLRPKTFEEMPDGTILCVKLSAEGQGVVRLMSKCRRLLREIEVAHNEYLKNRGYATDEERAISFEFALDFLENKKSDLHQTISEIMLADTKKWVDASGNQTVLELLRNKAQLVLIEGWMICTMPPNRKGTVSVYSNGATLQ